MSRGPTLRRVGMLVLGVNVVLFAAKGVVALRTGSLAVEAEAINSLSDSVYSLVVLAGLYVTTRPPDLDHPHGHERIEPFVSLFVAAGIFAVGGTVLYQSGQSLLSGDVTVAEGPTAAAVLLAGGAVKYLFYRYCLRVADRENSPAIRATAMDNRADVLTAVAAVVGVVGAQLGVPELDPLAAMVVAVGILHAGVEVVRDNFDYLVGRAPPEDLRREIVQTALGHPDVEGVHDVVAHYVGPEIDVSLHIEVQGERTLFEAHDIETEVKRSIEALPEVDDAFVHVDPKELGEWKDDDEADRLAGKTTGRS